MGVPMVVGGESWAAFGDSFRLGDSLHFCTQGESLLAFGESFRWQAGQQGLPQSENGDPPRKKWDSP